MKTFVVTVMDDVCAKNNRDPEATSLIEAARTFGKVETLEAVMAAERTKYEGVIHNLRQQLEANAESGVTEAELEVLRAVRKKAAAEAVAYEHTISERDAQLQAIRQESENRAAQIKAIYGF